MEKVTIQAPRPAVEGALGKTQGKTESGESFGDILKSSIDEVNRLQGQANHAIEDLSAGATKSIHETMIALEKAEISFKLMIEVRNKILDAYREVMRMGV
jgi:flagellar hook-basal body complex protein FliE